MHALWRLTGALILLGVAAAGASAETTGDAAPAAPSATEAAKLSPRTDGVMAAYSATYDGELTTQDLRLKAAAPLVRGPAFGLGLLAGYAMTHLAFPTETGDDSLRLHRFEATLAAGSTLAPGRSIRVSLGTAYASDLRVSAWSALQVTSSATVHWVLGSDDAILLGAVYTSAPEFSPVLPIIGYVHQRDGSRFRFDMFIPKHVRAEYELHPRVRGALGIEALGNIWAVQRLQAEQSVKRAGGSIFGELGFQLARWMRLEVRAGVCVMRHTLPADAIDAESEQSLRAGGFTQLLLRLVQ
jgi:hypothetical protein